MNCLLKCIFATISLSFFTNDALAYLDPGTGSYVLQLVIGAILGMGIAFKMYWTKVMNLFRKKGSKKDA
ncbi:MAG: hypothetical protein N2450_06730 [bacterium]|nr:hypothetical protein [bacterium]